MSDAIDIAVKDVTMVFSKGIKKIQALEQVTFDVRRGEMFCLVGPSGCGKSTLLRIMLGFLTPTIGEVLINDDRKKKGTAYIHQSSSLLPWRTLLQNACLGAEIREPLNRDIIDRIRNEIKTYKLDGFEGHLYSELSGGMRQRTDIIRALESRPTLLFCDEPFSAIDFVTRLELITRFKRMCWNGGITTVFVTHNIEEAIFLGNEIAVLSGRPGRVVATHRPKLPTDERHDAVKCRRSQEFADLFQQIWKELGHQDV